MNDERMARKLAELARLADSINRRTAEAVRDPRPRKPALDGQLDIFGEPVPPPRRDALRDG